MQSNVQCFIAFLSHHIQKLDTVAKSFGSRVINVRLIL